MARACSTATVLPVFLPNDRRLPSQDPPTEIRRELLYSCSCCHAAFGDVDNAWMCLRGAQLLSSRTPLPRATLTLIPAPRPSPADAIEMGLDYSTVDEDPTLMRMEAAPQVRIQLRKYAEGRIKSSGTVARQQFEASRNAGGGGGGGAAPRTGAPSLRDLDMSADTDDSLSGIAKRVALLLLVAVVLSVVLFNAGLQYAMLR